MIEAYILVVLTLVLTVGHFLLFHIVLKSDYETKLRRYQAFMKNRLYEVNKEFVDKMQDIIELDPEAIELLGFGDIWRRSLASIQEIDKRTKKIWRDQLYVYIVILPALFSAVAALLWPAPIKMPSGYRLYLTSVSWWFILFTFLAMIVILARYQKIENLLSQAVVIKNNDDDENKKKNPLSSLDWLGEHMKRKGS